MEGLYIELADGATNDYESSWSWIVGSPANQIPAGPPTSATGEAVDIWPGEIQNGLRQWIRERHMAMNANLRASSTGNPSEVWNHDVYRYASAMAEAPGGNERIVAITTVITSNIDGPAMPADGLNRQETYVYILEYNANGEIDGSSPSQNWISCTAYAPAELGTVHPETFAWNASHSGITLANVEDLY
jgi:hypothetical protein